jgi:energy coupling factor transporter S component ThiW
MPAEGSEAFEDYLLESYAPLLFLRSGAFCYHGNLTESWFNHYGKKEEYGMNNIQKLSFTAMITALTTITSSIIYIPVGFARIFPIQHLANVLAAVILGPVYAVAQAFAVSMIRNMTGTGSIFAFPGSMIGAVLAALLYKKTRNIGFAVVGEVLGTGIFGAIACYPIALLFLGNKMTLFGFIPSFLISSLSGSAIAFILLKIFIKNRYLEGLLHENSINNRRL